MEQCDIVEASKEHPSRGAQPPSPIQRGKPRTAPRQALFLFFLQFLLAIMPLTAAAAVKSVSVNPTVVQGGTVCNAAVVLTAAAPTGGVTVTLASSAPTVAGVPAQVSIPSGGISATFPVNAFAVAASSDVTITATSAGSSGSAVLTVTPPGGNWLDPAWRGRSTVNVASQGVTTLQDFQVRLVLDSSFDFSSVKADGSDLRLTRDDGITAIPFWIESWNAQGKSATVWVKVPAVPAAGATVFLYYGNAAASSASSGSATFDFFEDFEPSGSGTVPGYYALGAPETVLVQDQSWENFAPHTLSVVQANSGGYTYWGYYGLQDSCGGVGLAFSNDLSHWTKYQGNPLFEDGRWPSVLLVNGTFYMVHTTNYCGDSYLVLATSTDGINFTRVKTLVPAQTGKRNQNPDLYHNPNDGKYYLYWFSGNNPYLIKARSATTIEGLSDASSEKIVMQSSQPIAAPNMLFRDGTYFLSTETLDSSGAWITNIYSSTSPTTGFTLLPGNPVLADGNACLFQHVFGNTLHTYECKQTSGVWTVEHRSANLAAGRIPYPTQAVDPARWTPTGGAWQVVNDVQQDGSTGYALQGNFASRELLMSTYQGGDYVLEAYGKQVGGRVWGVGARVQNSASYYSANLYEDLDTTKNLYAYRWVNGGASTLGSAATGTVRTNEWHKLSVKAHGTAMDLYKDNVLVLQNTISFTSGGVALYGEAGTLAEYNNVVVRKYASPEPTVTVASSTKAQISLAASTVIGGDGVQGTLTLSAPAPAGGATVLLSSSDPATVAVPPSVTIAAGSTSATFSAVTTAVASTVQVVITSSYGGALQSATVTLLPPLAVSSLTISPSTIQGGDSSQGTVTLNRAATAPVQVALGTTAGSLVTVPGSVTVAAGASSATFTITSQAVGTTTAVTVSATLGASTQSGTLTLTPQPLRITTTTLPFGTEGGSYSATLTATGGAVPYSWSASGTPPGLSVSPAGVVSGTPTTEGCYVVTLQVQDRNGTTTTSAPTVGVAPVPVFALESSASGQSATFGTTVSSTSVSTATAALLIASITGTDPSATGISVASVTNSGSPLTWTKGNGTALPGVTAETWWAYAPSAFTGTVTATLNQPVASRTITVTTFTQKAP